MGKKDTVIENQMKQADDIKNQNTEQSKDKKQKSVTKLTSEPKSLDS